MREVQFFFSLGSRYSYLAATQVPKLAAETGARFVWRPLSSRELIPLAGSDPFRPEVRRGQYEPAYRTRDATRWAAFYGVPYREPDWTKIDSRLLALACIAAASMNAAEAFALKLFNATFGEGTAPTDENTLVTMAAEARLDAAAFKHALQSPATSAQHQRNIDDAAAAGAFGVPSFVVDGELFWGQDRMVLLRDHLLTR